LARDKVYVAAGEGTDAGRPVFSGMHVTFPQWSPREDKLSLWVTFMPAYRSVVSHLLGWGLRPGDPAAVFDLKTGQLAWLPANGQTLEQHLQELLDPSNLVGSLLQDLYVAEVFLSLDAPQDGEAFFRTALGQADTDAARLSRAIVLGQILLLEKKHREYAKLATETIAPLLTTMLKPLPAS